MFAQLLTTLSLKNTDAHWQSTLSSSTLFALVRQPAEPLLSYCKNAAVGSFFQKLSFLLTVILFACLALPCFVNDKEGLALILVASAVVYFVGTMAGGKEKRTASAIDLLVIAYGCINLIAAASSHYFAESIRGLAKVCVYLIGYFLFTGQLSNNWRRTMVLVTVLLATGTLVAVYGLYQYKIGVAPLATWEDPSIEDKATRIYSTLNNPNLLAGYLVPLVPLAGSLALSGLVRRQWLVGFLAAIAFAVLTVATVLTGSRGGYLGLFGGCAALVLILGSFLWRRHPGWRPMVACLIILIPLALCFAYYCFPSFQFRVLSMFAGREHSSNSFRLNVWLSSLAMLKDNWWFGIGVGNQAFRLVYGLYMRSGFDALGTYCVPLEVAVETGVVGVVIFSLLVLACLARAHISFWAAHSSFHHYLIAGAAAATIGLMIHGLVDTVFFRPQVQLIFWLLISILATCGYTDQDTVKAG